ncbi:GTPase-activating protein gyp7 [Zancudomyces culisetae]|uniref:GTPase-activating protein GYP7 n=1 Tax=Zancudomyces culisetae TaxID=1213189 RepID=A0A1R1PEL3_ZANCU|nr:GTPase-activating protein gyp7 [Zancudomyces culisetae]|eukprot:OMH79358.1 GTPase-activating protein gyp7 [Zancudomyces culisetae]
MGGGGSQKGGSVNIEDKQEKKYSKLLYAKSKVYVYRSDKESDKIAGLLGVLEKEPGELYISWGPESLFPDKEKEKYIEFELCNDRVSNTDIQDSVGYYVEDIYLERQGELTGTDLYVFCIKLEDIYAFLCTWPAFTRRYGSITINLHSGVTMPPLHFHDEESASRLFGLGGVWGGQDLLTWLDTFYSICRAERQMNLFIVGPKRDGDSLKADGSKFEEKSGKVREEDTRDDSPTAAKWSPEEFSKMASKYGEKLYQDNKTKIDPIAKQVSDIRWNVFETFSHITKAVRDATKTMLDHPAAQPIVPLLPASVQELSTRHGDEKNSYFANRMARGKVAGMQNATLEYESARVYLAKWAGMHIFRKENEENEMEIEMAGLKDKGRITEWERTKNPSIWDEWQSERGELGDFDVIFSESSMDLPKPLRTQKPLSAETWYGYFYKDGVMDPEERLLVDKQEILKAIFSGGIEGDIRPVVWKYLLGIYPWDSSIGERNRIDKENNEKYYHSKGEWLHDAELKDGEDYVEQSSRIEKDVLRTDRNIETFATDEVAGTDAEHLTSNGMPGSSANLEQLKDILMTYHYTDNHESAERLGYVQGMSDLLTPIYAVFQNEVDTYFGFVGFMNRMRRNFLRNQSGMTDQLETLSQLVRLADPMYYDHLEKTNSSNMFCCFRWLLIWFKREFSFAEITQLWEVLWTDYLSEEFVLLVALAILLRHKDVIMDHLIAFDEVLKYVNELSGCIRLNVALKDAELLFYRLRQRINNIDVEVASTIQRVSEGLGDSEEKDNNGKVVEGTLVDLDSSDNSDTNKNEALATAGSSAAAKSTQPTRPAQSTQAKESKESMSNVVATPAVVAAVVPERIRKIFYP